MKREFTFPDFAENNSKSLKNVFSDIKQYIRNRRELSDNDVINYLKYRKIVWQCNNKFKDKNYCKMPHVTEDEIKDAFVVALNKVLTIQDEVITNLKDVQRSLGNTDQLKVESERLSEELNVIANIIQKIIEENAITAQDQDDYQRRYNEQVDRYKKTENELKAVQ